MKEAEAETGGVVRGKFKFQNRNNAVEFDISFFELPLKVALAVQRPASAFLEPPAAPFFK